ncbi:MAG: DUF6463 family protein [Gemmatimonadetes bacterium]|nr:DUF6463 family protein [Gemmatimonadota bacterium]
MQGVAPAILIGIGVLHSTIGLIQGWSTIGSLFRLGFWDSIDRAEADLLLWFMTAGVFLIFLGCLGWWVERRLDRPLPQGLGWGLLAFTLVAGVAVGDLVFPASLFILAALIIVVRSRRYARITSVGT